MKTILITGAGGYLGGYLIEQLSKVIDVKIFALDLEKEVIKNKFQHIRNIEFYDLKELELEKLPFININSVVHLAFSRAHKGEFEIAKSLIFTNELFNKIRKYKIPELINISSQEVYGVNYTPLWLENLIPSPNTIYGFAKFSSEILTQNLTYQGFTNATSLRLAGLIGQDADTRLVSKFVDRVINELPIKILGGNQVLSQIDVRDAVAGIISLLDISSSNWKCTYNLGYIRSYTIFEIVDLVAEKARLFGFKDLKITVEDSEVKINAGMDSTLFYNDTGWKPEYDMGSIIESIFSYKMNLNI